MLDLICRDCLESEFEKARDILWAKIEALEYEKKNNKATLDEVVADRNSLLQHIETANEVANDEKAATEDIITMLKHDVSDESYERIKWEKRCKKAEEKAEAYQKLSEVRMTTIAALRLRLDTYKVHEKIDRVLAEDEEKALERVSKRSRTE